MKPRTLFFIGAIGGCILGIFPGYIIGDSLRDAEERNRSYDDLKASIRQRELLQISDLIEANLKVESRDEGGLFKTKMVYYITGEITNKSIATPVKDIKIQVSYVSGTNSVISSEDVTIYTVVPPYHTTTFKEKISPPDKTESYQYSLRDVKVD
ncbi:MAG TPA: hypothetical protein VFE50_22170 [Cyclobacteriaceae bacterium]|nr:hypothetical protein [Cyclobacteriaceae bacterium]